MRGGSRGGGWSEERGVVVIRVEVLTEVAGVTWLEWSIPRPPSSSFPLPLLLSPCHQNPSPFYPHPLLLSIPLLLPGAHEALLVRAPPPVMARNDPPSPPTLLLLMLLCVVASCDASDSDVLFKFKESLANDTALGNWNASTSPCSGNKGNWVGVLCSKGTVLGLQLENMGLMGLIDVDSLMGLPNLRTVSFMNNSFEGPMPDIKKLGALKSLFLSNNNFSGEIPDEAFAGMGSLKKIYLANNEFTGKIPLSLVAVPRLLQLRLEGNQFQGKIPDFRQKDLRAFNVSNNELEGKIPAGLSKMDTSSFSGNKDLCGKPLDTCKSSKKPSVLMIAMVVIAVGVALAAIGAFFIIIRHRRRQTSESGKSPSTNKQNKVVSSEGDQMESGSPEFAGTNKKAENGKLSFVRDDRERFDLQDLLRASAEVLGSGSFGSSYKAVLLSGPAMVVKRFRQMNNVGREEFQEHMRRLGRLRHPNLLPLVAYYYRKEEKLLVSDFVENGSLAGHLHGKHTSAQPGLDWPTRLKIIKGVAKGLAYLYNELPTLIVPHGHLKSSNVLLDEFLEPLLTDYALVPVVNQEHAQELMIAYKSPEYAQYGRTTKKTDVWSLGILILEMLTGKFPANYLKQGKRGDGDLASWVNSVVREEWTGEVFDNEMGGTKNGQGEMLKLLKIGLDCCERDVERRWDLGDAIEKIEELRERDSDEEYSSYASEGEMYSSRAQTEDDFSFSLNN
ncbi:hypothetical protein HHK36_021003 [Tetracentron sinense]|uniref:non-specific serine/threonine protein kinase n=1 Tax=Tetracentron sinense TaxID=13715 RepID=A0A834YW47_TETSI|nr:hypothetical protein HHK36_021003 [Tetracentron sinense]